LKRQNGENADGALNRPIIRQEENRRRAWWTLYPSKYRRSAETLTLSTCMASWRINNMAAIFFGAAAEENEITIYRQRLYGGSAVSERRGSS